MTITSYSKSFFFFSQSVWLPFLCMLRVNSDLFLLPLPLLLLLLLPRGTSNNSSSSLTTRWLPTPPLRLASQRVLTKQFPRTCVRTSKYVLQRKRERERDVIPLHVMMVSWYRSSETHFLYNPYSACSSGIYTVGDVTYLEGNCDMINILIGILWCAG